MPSIYLRCNSCGGRVLATEPLDDHPSCPACHGRLRAMSPVETLFQRWIGPPRRPASEIEQKHFKLIELIWTEDARSLEFYHLVRPRGLSYGSFLRQTTELICRAITEGWVELVMPKAPVGGDGVYELRFIDPERFVTKLCEMYPESSPDRHDSLGAGK